ncbi:hypothetical protein TNCV_1246471 [Trichonephila clavipes]|uniref:DUF4817 domain-containing protein n=1 Tax=Trichonephila clavipes TaxID=2585209 RepID=A0A8X6V107_TRICX|nr:hypothetical protein TNCV_1246471 [Trichonephila clavipes]
MLIVYGTADCKGHATRKLYQERYPNWRIPHRTTFGSVNRRLLEIGSLTKAKMNRRSWWSGTLTCQIKGPVMLGLLLGSNEKFRERDSSPFS